MAKDKHGRKIQPSPFGRLLRAGKAFIVTDTIIGGAVVAAHEIAVNPDIAIPATIMVALGGVVGVFAYFYEKIFLFTGDYIEYTPPKRGDGEDD